MFKDLVKKSRSYRSFQPGKTLSLEVLRELCDTARFAPAATNLQPLKYRLVYKEEERKNLLALTYWAGSLGIKLPPDGHEPAGYIVICHDTSLSVEKPIFLMDVGIAAQTMMLAAAERRLGGCMLGAFKPEDVSACLGLPEGLNPKLILAFGTPDETVVLTEVKDRVKYYRDEHNVHYVPKRSLDEIIL
ncbi:MAG: nitroreductase family protein [Clostridia bacterium]|nr:nitroreductase family protein [Clostridia bacterium]